MYLTCHNPSCKFCTNMETPPVPDQSVCILPTEDLGFDLSWNDAEENLVYCMAFEPKEEY